MAIDAVYLRERVLHHRQEARASTDARIAALHHDLAERYEQLVLLLAGGSVEAVENVNSETDPKPD